MWVHNRLLLRLADTMFKRRNQQILILDIDSTQADTYGKQESASYNAHYGIDGFHPILIFDSITGILLAVKQRPGNVYTSRDADEFLRPLLKHYQKFSCDMNILVRGDSGFATPTIYDLCEETGCQFLVKLKHNSRLTDLVQHQVTYDDNTDFSMAETQIFELDYQVETWLKPYWVAAQDTRNGGSLFMTTSQ
ncbi:transposase [Lactiplantibacillus pentosus]|uniref:transposase n=1 Tax=Lactiplantibacillus pentosus TaxID=1589 RepID=UPI0038572A98